MPTHMNDWKAHKAQARGWFRTPVFKIVVSLFLFIFIGTSAVFLYYYAYYSRMIDRKLSGEVFKNTARVYAVPYHIYPGQKLSPDMIVARLQRAGFEPSSAPKGDDGVYECPGVPIVSEDVPGLRRTYILIDEQQVWGITVNDNEPLRPGEIWIG